MSNRKQTADGLKRAANSYLLKRGYACCTEIAIARFGKLKADVLAVNLRGDLVLMEIKSGVQDFIADHRKSKWKQYLFACNKFYWVLTEATAEKLRPYFEEFKTLGCGVLVLDSNSGYLRSILPSKYRRMVGRDKRNIIIRLAWRSAETSKRNARRTRIFLQ